MNDSFSEDLLNELVEEALTRLPRGTKFLGYATGVFEFIQRRDSGKTILHRMMISTLDAIRHGFHRAKHTSFEIAASSGEGQVRWEPRFGLYGAPDGLPLVFHTAVETDRLTSYGFARDGQYHRVCGTNWSCRSGWYVLWDDASLPIVLHDGRLRINPVDKDTPSTYDLWVDPSAHGPDMDVADLAHKVNAYLERNNESFFRKGPPSPGYLAADRWSYDTTTETWTFQ